MKIAIEGCAHGELDNIYESISHLEKTENQKIDLLICCGDFQASRNQNDLQCMAVPDKYKDLRDFYKYHNGEKEAPVLTIFIGGNHEASNYLQELPYGGWVAPNIFYLGYAGVVNIGGLRIGGLSGIYKSHDYLKGRFESVPYSKETVRSVYHIRNLDVFRFKQLSGHMDIFLSHDWPNKIFEHGNLEQLLRYKPFFKDDIQSDKIGSPPCQELLEALKPSYWFAAHLHCKYAALIPHDNKKFTKFLALDKCLPKKRFLQLLDIPHDETKALQLHYDLEWLTILKLTNHLTSIKANFNYMPGSTGTERWNFTPTEKELNEVQNIFDDLRVPHNFVRTTSIDSSLNFERLKLPFLNPQTKSFCTKLGVDDPLELLLEKNGLQFNEKVEDSILELSKSAELGNVGPSNISAAEKNLNSSDSLHTSPMQRLSLNLPKPKSEALNNTDVDEDDKIVAKEIIENTMPVNEHEENSSSKMFGKFKRRNANIYDETE